MNLMSFQSSRISPLVPLGTTHGTMENARLHREEVVDVANEIVDKKLDSILPQLYQEAYTSAYQSFMEDLSFDVTTCVNVALSSGEVILNDKRNQRIIAEHIMEELRKQIGSKMTFSI